MFYRQLLCRGFWLCRRLVAPVPLEIRSSEHALDVAFNYVSEHKITFSTDQNPEKSKTKGITFSSKEIIWEPSPLQFCGNSLPWVKSAKYVGNRILNHMDGLQSDIKIKRSKYIEKNVELNQEFSFARPDIKTRINQIYNSSFPGSVLWDLTSRNVRC